MIPRTTVTYLVMEAIFFCPSSSFASLSRGGIATQRSCMMIDELMYGVIDRANRVP